MWRDLREAVRGFRRTPAFTAAATLALGLAIGANAAVFSLVDGLWLRPPGATRPQELVRIFQTSPSSREGRWSFREYEALRDRATSLPGVVAMGRRGALVASADGSRDLVLVNVVSLDFFTVLGVVPVEGRLFAPADRPALLAEPSIVLGFTYWQRQFGGDPAVVGRRLTLGAEPGTPVRVLGVLPPTFRELDAAADRDLWMPVTTWTTMHGESETSDGDNRWFDIVGRVTPGHLDSAEREVATVMGALSREWPETNANRSARLQTDLDYRLQNGGANITALIGLVLAVVLITCVNIAHLLLSRAAMRRRETALRSALGASRARIIGQLFAEAAVLGLFGAVAGLLTGAWLVRVLPWFLVAPPGFRSFEVFLVDGRVITFSLGVTLLMTLLFALAPALQATRTNAAGLIKGGAGLLGATGSERRLGHVLLVGQVAVSLALVYGATVLARSADAVARADLGFTREPVTTAWIPYGDVSLDVVDDALDRVRALPGAGDVAVAIRAPLSLSGGGLAQPVVVPGMPAAPDGSVPDVLYGAVSANYFAVMGTPLVEGRAFTEAESRGGEPVVVLTRAFVDRYMDGTRAIGRLVRLGGPGGVDHRVVGVAGDAALNRIGGRPEPYLYVPYWRAQTGEATFLLRPTGTGSVSAADLRQTLSSVDTRLSPRLVVAMGQYIDFATSDYRTTAALAASLSAMGLVLLTIGIYGVLTYQTSRRAKEIGIRVAVGAARSEVMRLVLAEGLRLALAGLVIGVPLAMAMGRTLASLLFGVGPWSWTAMAVASLVLVVSVLAATAVPAWRATRVSPVTALRET